MPVADSVERLFAVSYAIQPSASGPTKPSSQRTGNHSSVAVSRLLLRAVFV